MLENLKVMLISEEKKMQTAAEKTTAESIAKVGKKASALNTIVDMGGEDSGCSGIILSHLEGEIKSNVLSTSSKLRQACFIVMKLMLRQGLVHPMEHAAHLIALGADPIDEIKVSANKQLDDLNTQYPDFVQQKAVEGMITTYKFKALLAKAKVAGAGVTGFKQGREAGDNSAELHHLYTLLKPKRTIRRCFVREIVALFGRSQEGVPRGQLVFVAGNMAHFPYSLNEETLYVVHEITLLTAVRGSQIQNAFRVLLGYNDALSEAEEEDSAADVADRIGDELTEDFVTVMREAQALVGLLAVKQFLQRVCGYTEARCEDFNPDDAASKHRSPIYKRSTDSFEAPDLPIVPKQISCQPAPRRSMRRQRPALPTPAATHQTRTTVSWPSYMAGTWHCNP